MSSKLRQAAVLLHRYVGLVIALFLIILSLTGSVLTFDYEIDAWLNPDLFRSASVGRHLSPDELIGHLQRSRPDLRVSSVSLDTADGRSSILGVEPRRALSTAERHLSHVNQLFVDPVTGAVLGGREAGACCLDRRHLIPFLYEVHRSLYLPAPWGRYVTGTVALLWAIDCFVALSLTLPRGRPFWAKWRIAWTFKRKASSARFNLDVHRAGGLWAWGLLLTMAVSAVGLNLKNEIFRPLLSVISPPSMPAFDLVRRRPDMTRRAPSFSFDAIVERARQEASRRHWTVPPGGVWYLPRYGAYGVHFRTAEGRGRGLGARFLYYDAMTGHKISEIDPGSGTVGDLVFGLPLPIHSGSIAGLAGRILICITGLMVALLSVTGICIWWRKRAARTLRRIPCCPPRALLGKEAHAIE